MREERGKGREDELVTVEVLSFGGLGGVSDDRKVGDEKGRQGGGEATGRGR